MLRTAAQRLAIIIVLVGALAVVSPSVASAHGANQNGCSSSPDSGYAPMYFNFHASCDWHDLCYHNHPYGGGTAGRKACDDGFKSRMRSWCATQYPGTWKAPARYDCYALAETYYRAVRAFGGSHF